MNEKKEAYLLGGFVSLILLIAAGIFLFGKNEFGHTGLEIIAYQGAWYIISMVLLALVGVAAAYYAYKLYVVEPNKKALAAAIVAIIFFAIAFGKGCTDKANDGVTGPKGRPVAEATK